MLLEEYTAAVRFDQTQTFADPIWVMALNSSKMGNGALARLSVIKRGPPLRNNEIGAALRIMITKLLLFAGHVEGSSRIAKAVQVGTISARAAMPR